MKRDEPVFSSDGLPGRSLRVQRTLPANARDLGAQLHRARQDVIRETADRIGRDEHFVKLTPSDGVFVHLHVDCIVLTTDEYAELCREKFAQGLRHAQSFAPFEFRGIEK